MRRSTVRRIVTVLAVLIFAWAGAVWGQMPKPVKKLDAFAEQMATQIRVISTWSAPAQAVDSVVIFTSLASQLVTHQKVGTALADTAFFPITLAPSGGSVGGQVDVLTRRRGLSGTPVTTSFNFTRSDVPPPPVGALVVKADSV
jgi:hypothetical protein